MKPGPTLQCMAPRLIIPSIYGYTNVYGTGSVNIWKTRHKISADIRIFFCSVRHSCQADAYFGFRFVNRTARQHISQMDLRAYNVHFAVRVAGGIAEL